MRIEKWEAGAKFQRECPKMTEFLVLEGEACDDDGEGEKAPPRRHFHG